MSEPFLTFNTPSTDDAAARLESVREAAGELLSALGAEGVSLVVAGISVRCDECGDSAPRGESFAAALDRAAERGWTHSDDGTDKCDDCTRADA